VPGTLAPQILSVHRSARCPHALESVTHLLNQAQNLLNQALCHSERRQDASRAAPRSAGLSARRAAESVVQDILVQEIVVQESLVQEMSRGAPRSAGLSASRVVMLARLSPQTSAFQGCIISGFGFREVVDATTRGEESAYFNCWILKFVLVTRTGADGRCKATGWGVGRLEESDASEATFASCETIDGLIM